MSLMKQKGGPKTWHKNFKLAILLVINLREGIILDLKYIPHHTSSIYTYTVINNLQSKKTNICIYVSDDSPCAVLNNFPLIFFPFTRPD